MLQQRVQNPTKRAKLDESVAKNDKEPKEEYISDNDDNGEYMDPAAVFGDDDDFGADDAAFDEDMPEDENAAPKREPSLTSQLQNIR